MSAPKHYGAKPEVNHSKRNLVLGILIAVLVIAVIAYANWPKHNNTTAVQIGERGYTVDEVNYFYTQASQQEAQMASLYAQLGMEGGGYDSSLPASEQIQNQESGKTYAEYFRETALTNLQQVAILLDQAKQAGHTLSDKGKESVEQQLKGLEDSILQAQITQGGSKEYYLKRMYGEGMTQSLLKSILTDVTLANEYAETRAEEFTYDDAALDTYYQASKDDLDSYDYRLFYIAAKPETDGTVDAEGKPTEPTEAQTDAALKLARASANEMLGKVKAGANFSTTAASYAEEADKAKYQDGDAALTTDAQGSALSGSSYGDWLMDAARRPNDMTVTDNGTSGCYVVQFVSREKRNNSVETLDVRSLLVTAETTENTAEDGTVTSAPSEEQLAAAKTKAEDLLARFNEAAEKTPEAFLALAPADDKAVTTDTQEKLARSAYGTDFDKQAFQPGSVSVGDVLLVEATDSSSQVIGYRLVYVNALGQSRWMYAAETSLREADYTKWFEELKPNYEPFVTDAMNQIGA